MEVVPKRPAGLVAYLRSESGSYGWLCVTSQDWRSGRRFARRTDWQLRNEYLLVLLADGLLRVDEGFLGYEGMQKLKENSFIFAGLDFRVEWLSGQEADRVFNEHFAEWISS